MRVWTRGELRDGDARSHVVAGGERLTGPGEDHHPYGVVRLRCPECLVQLDEHPAVLRVARLRPVQGDADDAPLVQLFVSDELVSGHDALPLD